MDDTEKIKLAEITCQITSMIFVLEGCCKYYEGEKLDTANLIEFIETLNKVSNNLFDLL